MMTESQPGQAHDDFLAAENLLHDPSSSSVNTAGGPPQLPSHILQIIEHQSTATNTPSLADIQAYPTTAYFNQTIIPIILEGLTTVARERPMKPIEYLAAFFMKNRERYGEIV